MLMNLEPNNKIVDLDIPDGINADKDSVTIKLINKNKTKIVHLYTQGMI